MRFWSIHLLRVLGIRLELHLSFLLVVGLWAWLGWERGAQTGALAAVITGLLIFACIILHEFGHCLTAQRFGIGIEKILILPIGGMAQFSSIPREPRAEFLITAAGPAVNFALFGLMFAFLGTGAPLSLTFALEPHSIAAAVMWANLVLGIFNLLPIFPMDGGRLLRASLASRFSYLTATRVAVVIAKTLALLGIFWALMHTNFLLAALLLFMFVGGQMEYDMVKRQELFSGLRAGSLAMPGAFALPANTRVGEACGRAARSRGVLAMNGSEPCGWIPAEHLERLIADERGHEPLSAHARDIRLCLQADEPLDAIRDALAQRQALIVPVYRGGDLVGIIDTRRADEALFWARYREKLHRACGEVMVEPQSPHKLTPGPADAQRRSA